MGLKTIFKKIPWEKVGKGASIAGAAATGIGAVIRVATKKDEVGVFLEKILEKNSK